MSLQRHRWLVVPVIVVAGLVGGGYAWYRHTYPFGRSHCCDKQLYFALRNFADANAGAFPTGEATPEASLSLIYPTNKDWSAYLLCGKSGSGSVAQEILDQGMLLGPDSCGWNYIEDLRSDDDYRLALLWDKEGLGHNGQRLSEGGHIVTFLDGGSEYIPETKWDEFLAEQKVLFAKRKNVKKEDDRIQRP